MLPGLDRDLGHHGVRDDIGDKPHEAVARRAADTEGLFVVGALILGKCRQARAVDTRGPGCLLMGVQQASINPAPDRVVTDTEQGSRLRNPKMRHNKQYITAHASIYSGGQRTSMYVV